jgi:hypothetical protein
MKFLLFTFAEYEARGGANDLIAPSDGNTWEHFVAAFNANLKRSRAEEGFGGAFLLTAPRDRIQSLNLETMEILSANIEAERGADGVLKVLFFDRHPDTRDKPFAEGIPCVEHKRKVRHTPKPLTPADYVYYQISGYAETRLITASEPKEWVHFSIVVKRRLAQAFALNDKTTLMSIARDFLLASYLYENGDRLNQELGEMHWTTRVEAKSVFQLENYACALGVFTALPQEAAEARQIYNPTYAVIDNEKETPDA